MWNQLRQIFSLEKFINFKPNTSLKRIESFIDWYRNFYKVRNNNFPDSNNCNIAVIGLGYVGLPLAIEFSKTKKDINTNENLSRKVIGYDILESRVNELNSGIDRTREISKDVLIKELDSLERSLVITNDKNLLIEADLFIITVPICR